MKLKRGEIATWVKNNLSVVRWRDKRGVYILTNMHSPPTEGNSVDDSYNAIKPKVIEDYNKHMGYVDKSDWPIATELAEEHGNGLNNYFSI